MCWTVFQNFDWYEYGYKKEGLLFHLEIVAPGTVHI